MPDWFPSQRANVAFPCHDVIVMIRCSVLAICYLLEGGASLAGVEAGVTSYAWRVRLIRDLDLVTSLMTSRSEMLSAVAVSPNYLLALTRGCACLFLCLVHWRWGNNLDVCERLWGNVGQLTPASERDGNSYLTAGRTREGYMARKQRSRT